jgi:hypothetical protein
MSALKRGDLVFIFGREPQGMGVVMECLIGINDFVDDYYFVCWLVLPGGVQPSKGTWYGHDYLTKIEDPKKYNKLKKMIDF